MTDEEMIAEYLKNHEVTLCPSEPEYLGYKDYRRGNKTQLERYGVSTASFVCTNKPKNRYAINSLDSDSMEVLSHIKPSDIDHFIGRSFTYKGELVTVVDFDFFVRKNIVERYVLSNGILLSPSRLKKRLKV